MPKDKERLFQRETQCLNVPKDHSAKFNQKNASEAQIPAKTAENWNFGYMGGGGEKAG